MARRHIKLRRQSCLVFYPGSSAPPSAHLSAFPLISHLCKLYAPSKLKNLIFHSTHYKDAVMMALHELCFMKKTDGDAEEISAAEVSQLANALTDSLSVAQRRNERGWTLLQTLTRYGKGHGAAECINLLLQAHPQAAHEMTAEGWLPLHFAVRNMDGSAAVAKCVQLLLQANPLAAQDKDPDGMLQLHLAAANAGGSRDAAGCMRLLLQAHPQAAQEKIKGCFPLHAAARSMGGDASAIECAELLLRAHPEATQEGDPDGRLPLHLLAESEARPSLDFVRLLVDAFPQALSAKDKTGRTPLQAAEHWKRMPPDALAELRRFTKNGESFGFQRSSRKRVEVSKAC